MSGTTTSRSGWVATALLSAGLLATLTVPAGAQVEGETAAPGLEIGGRVHMQFNTSSVDEALDSEFLVRRARLTIDADINDWIDGRVQPDFGGGSLSLKDAYLRLSFDPALRIRFGQFKRPFDLFELTSSSRILVIERAGGVRGVEGCPGPGGVCSFSRLTEKLEYSDRDIGAEVAGALSSDRISYALAVTNGTGAGAPEENGTKSISGRVAYEVIPNLRVAGNFSTHDYPDPRDDSDDFGTAVGGDVEWGDFSGGLHVQAGFVTGENWRNLRVSGEAFDGSGVPEPATFRTAQLIATWRRPVPENRWVEAVEPVARLSWGDPDDERDGDDGVLWTPGVMLHFVGRNKIAANVDVWSPDSGDDEVSLKVQTYLHF